MRIFFSPPFLNRGIQLLFKPSAVGKGEAISRRCLGRSGWHNRSDQFVKEVDRITDPVACNHAHFKCASAALINFRCRQVRRKGEQTLDFVRGAIMPTDLKFFYLKPRQRLDKFQCSHHHSVFSAAGQVYALVKSDFYLTKDLKELKHCPCEKGVVGGFNVRNFGSNRNSKSSPF